MLKILLCCAGALLCFFGMYAQGLKRGFRDGFSDGYLGVLKDLVDGHLKVEGRKLIFDCKSVRFYDDDGPIYEMDMDKLDFIED